MENFKQCFNDSNIFFAPEIPIKKINGAISSYAIDANASDVDILIDETVLGSGKCGILITKAYLYAKEDFAKPLKINLDSIKTVSCKRSIMSASILINGHKIVSLTQPSGKALQQFANLFQNYINDRNKNKVNKEEQQTITEKKIALKTAIKTNNTDYLEKNLEAIPYPNPPMANGAIYYFEDNGEKEGVITSKFPLKIFENFGGRISFDRKTSNYSVNFSGIEFRENESQEINPLKIHKVNQVIQLLSNMYIDICKRYNQDNFGRIPLINEHDDIAEQLTTLKGCFDYLKGNFIQTISHKKQMYLKMLVLH